ncbi:uncharacterized protein LOC110108281 [Dendrobium catenatum]|uniref:uncharacterized protein LOC110108281 n=1 Tax=Dendrobium catenatum TaxID=906689 RepID=UPI0009F570BE|nr:uncharacterized protein LOC110108281 [Dendrobium catenatum]
MAKFSLLDASPQCVIGEFSIFNKGKWIVSTVYGNKNPHIRRKLREKLEVYCDKEIPLVVGGDFNCVLSQEEKRGGKKFSFSQGMQEMSAFMSRNDLLDVGMYEDVWASFLASKSIVLKTWNKPVNGDAMNVINVKCKRTLRALHYWSKAKMKNFMEIKDVLNKEIVNLQLEESFGHGLNEEKLLLLRAKIQEFNLNLARLSTWWRQRSKLKWIQENDMNSKFFHYFANGRRLGNSIRQLKDEDGILVEENAEIEEILMNFLAINGRVDVVT